MTDADFNALTARLKRPIGVSTIGADIDILIAHATRLRAAIAVILQADAAIDRPASIAHLRAEVGESDGLSTIPIGKADETYENLQLPRPIQLIKAV